MKKQINYSMQIFWGVILLLGFMVETHKSEIDSIWWALFHLINSTILLLSFILFSIFSLKNWWKK